MSTKPNQIVLVKDVTPVAHVAILKAMRMQMYFAVPMQNTTNPAKMDWAASGANAEAIMADMATAAPQIYSSVVLPAINKFVAKSNTLKASSVSTHNAWLDGLAAKIEQNTMALNRSSAISVVAKTGFTDSALADLRAIDPEAFDPLIGTLMCASMRLFAAASLRVFVSPFAKTYVVNGEDAAFQLTGQTALTCVNANLADIVTLVIAPLTKRLVCRFVCAANASASTFDKMLNNELSAVQPVLVDDMNQLYAKLSPTIITTSSTIGKTVFASSSSSANTTMMTTTASGVRGGIRDGVVNNGAVKDSDALAALFVSLVQEDAIQSNRTKFQFAELFYGMRDGMHQLCSMLPTRFLDLQNPTNYLNAFRILTHTSIVVPGPFTISSLFPDLVGADKFDYSKFALDKFVYCHMRIDRVFVWRLYGAMCCYLNLRIHYKDKGDMEDRVPENINKRWVAFKQRLWANTTHPTESRQKGLELIAKAETELWRIKQQLVSAWASDPYVKSDWSLGNLHKQLWEEASRYKIIDENIDYRWTNKSNPLVQMPEFVNAMVQFFGPALFTVSPSGILNDMATLLVARGEFSGSQVVLSAANENGVIVNTTVAGGLTGISLAPPKTSASASSSGLSEMAQGAIAIGAVFVGLGIAAYFVFFRKRGGNKQK